MTDLVIQTTELRKTFGSKVAVADLTLDVPRGEVFGFLGPNGAGKSTAVKMLLGLVRPDGGQARVLGQAPGHTPTLARIGFLPEHFRFHEWLQATEFLDLHGKLYGMPLEERRKRIPEVLDLVGLIEHSGRQLSGFSKGMLQRIGIAQALLNRPDLIFLDEPTSALDPFGRILVRGIIRELKSKGTTIFLNSHLLGEVEATCDRASFIREGVVLRTLSLHDLQAESLKVELRVDAVTPNLLAVLSDLVVEWRFLENDGSDLPPAHGGAMTEGEATAVATASALELTLQHEDMLPVVAERTIASGAKLYALTPRKVSLEQIFLEVVGSEDSGQ